MYHIGDFVWCDRSQYPVLVVELLDDSTPRFLASKREFQGDYIIISYANNTVKATLTVYEQLAEIAQYGEWWYARHKSIFQAFLVEAIV